MKLGDQIIMKQEKTLVKLPYDPEPHTVRGVKGAQITCWRLGKEKKKRQEKIKVVTMRPQHLRHRAETMNTRDTNSDMEDDVEINLDHDTQRNANKKDRNK